MCIEEGGSQRLCMGNKRIATQRCMEGEQKETYNPRRKTSCTTSDAHGGVNSNLAARRCSCRDPERPECATNETRRLLSSNHYDRHRTAMGSSVRPGSLFRAAASMRPPLVLDDGLLVRATILRSRRYGLRRTRSIDAWHSLWLSTVEQLSGGAQLANEDAKMDWVCNRVGDTGGENER